MKKIIFVSLIVFSLLLSSVVLAEETVAEETCIGFWGKVGCILFGDPALKEQAALATGQGIRGLPECTDSDGGENPGEKGTTEGFDTHSEEMGKETDECASEDYVNEWSCDGVNLVGDQIKCPDGTVCDDGACEKEEEEEPVTCEDPDKGYTGDSLLKQTTVRMTDGNTETDSCSGGLKVKEYYCEDRSIGSSVEDCPSKTRCDKGACVTGSTPEAEPEAEPVVVPATQDEETQFGGKCSDTDGGNKPLKKGTVYPYKGYDNIKKSDRCKNNVILEERYCGGIYSKGNSFTLDGVQFQYKGADNVDEENPEVRIRNVDNGDLYELTYKTKGKSAIFELELGDHEYLFYSKSFNTEDNFDIMIVGDIVDCGARDQFCDEGVCADLSESEIKCYDSDGGKEYFVKGTVKNDYQDTQNEDYCLNELDEKVDRGPKMKEYYCEGTDTFEQDIRCKSGCDLGACITDGTEEEEEESEVVECDGCLIEDRCFSLGAIEEISEVDSYCDAEGRWAQQFTTTAACEFNYECASNECVERVCVVEEAEQEQSNYDKLLLLWRRWFG